MIELVLCDDELNSLNNTKEYVASIASKWSMESEIITYDNPQELLRRLRSPEEHTDILLLDIDMPDITGLDVAKMIRDENRKISVYTDKGGQYTVWKKLKELKEEIEAKDDAFLQVHSGCVINLKYVKTLQNGSIFMNCDKEIEISICRRRQKEVGAIISKYWRDHS